MEMINFIEDLIVSNWTLIDGIITIISFAILLHISKIWNKFQLYMYKKSSPIYLFGLNEKTLHYIQSEFCCRKIIVVETNKNNPFITSLPNKNVLIEYIDPQSKKFINSLVSNKYQHCLIAYEDDLMNIDLAIKLLESIPSLKIFIHIQDRHLRHFHQEDGVLKGINIKIFSFYEDVARDVLHKFDIDGSTREIIDSKISFSVILVGNSPLLYELVYQICILGQLPNENHLTIKIVNKKNSKIQRRINLLFPEINSVPNVSLEFINTDCLSKHTYQNNFWNEPNLSNILICDTDEYFNLCVANNLKNITYLDKIIDDTLKVSILIALFDKENFHSAFALNTNVYSNFYSFGKYSEIFHKKYIIDDERDIKAKRINEIYNQKTKNNALLWEKRSYFEKESNRASADHIQLKEKYLKLNNDKELLSKCEHNRWNAFHFMHGWKYNTQTNKKKKLHACLVPYDELSEEFKDYDREIIMQILDRNFF